MSRNLIKYILRRTNNKAFTLTEILVATSFAIILMGAMLGFYILSEKTYSIGVDKHWLQDDANTVITKIIGGKGEPGGVFRLSEAVSYNIAGISELHFVGIDGIERWFNLDNSCTSVIYHHPIASGTADEIIYSAPAGATITLRFSIPTGAQYTGVVIGIDVEITNNVSGNAISGSASTYVNIRNHAV
jgi:hypothetical protein